MAQFTYQSIRLASDLVSHVTRILGLTKHSFYLIPTSSEIDMTL